MEALQCYARGCAGAVPVPVTPTTATVASCTGRVCALRIRSSSFTLSACAINDGGSPHTWQRMTRQVHEGRVRERSWACGVL